MSNLYELRAPLQSCKACRARNTATMADFFDKIDAEMKSFPWNYTEKYLLPDFLPSPGMIAGDFDGALKLECAVDPDRIEYQDASNLDPPEELPIHPDGTHEFPEFIEPLTPLSPSFPPHSMLNLSPPHVMSPTTNEFCGDFAFRMILETQPKKVANPDWIFSRSQKKLYIKPQTPCPVRFSTTGPPPIGAFIRAMPVFKQPEHAKDVVRCCPNHTLLEQNRDSPAPGHFIRCDNQEAEYEECPQTTRHSVRIPFRGPVNAEDGEEVGVHELFYFICNNSCGGLNRRPIQLIFTLENMSGSEVYGRAFVNVRVCACPGRDSKQEIEAINRPGSKRRKQKSTEQGLAGMSIAGASDFGCIGPKGSKEDSTVYNLKICGFNNYLMLKRIAIALELFTNMESKFTSMGPEELEMPDLSEYSPEDQDISEPDSTIMKSGTCESPVSIISQEPYSVTPQMEAWYSAIPQDHASRLAQTPQYKCYTYRCLTQLEYYETAF